MKLLISFIIIILIIPVLLGSITDELFVIRFNELSPETVTEFTAPKYDVASYKPGHFLDLVVDNKLYKEILHQGYNVEITQTESQLKENMIAGRDLEGYRTYEDLLTELQQLEVDYPDLCKLYDIGDTQGKIYSDAGNSNYDDYNHQIWALKLSDNVVEEEDEPGILYVGTHHAREPISLEVTMSILWHLLDNYGTDPIITNNVNNTQIWFIPLLNPNGHKMVTDEDCMFWRKNVRDNDENGYITPASSYTYSPDGVDPNRNYGFQWGFVGASGYSWHKNYNGPYPWSEPEIIAFKGLLDSNQFLACITYHSYGEFLIWPYNYSHDIVAPDVDALSELGITMASMIGYDAYDVNDLSPIMGCASDYAYGEKGVFCYAIELATQFIPPAWQIESICAENIGAALLLLDRINHSTLTGHIIDADTEEPLQAEIFIEGVDDTGSFRNPYISNGMYGTYYRMLTEGDYNVTVSAYGYESQSFEDISINCADVTVLDVALIPEPEIFDLTGSVTDQDTGMPIENVTIEILNIDIPSVTTDLNGEYVIQDLYPYDLEFKVYKDNYYVCQDVFHVSLENSEHDYVINQVEDESFENGELGSDWICEGNVDWFVDESTSYDGTYSARSGDTIDDEYANLIVTVCLSEEGEISFYRKVSSENNYDFFRFQIDDLLMGEWSGNLDWSYVSYPVSSGLHTFKWSYIKDLSISVGSDCAWIDEVIFETTDIQENKLPVITVLHQNRPNPFNPETEISYQLTQLSKVMLSVYNIKGQLVKTLFDEIKPAGVHTVIWDGRDKNDNSVTSGMYFYMLDTGTDKITRKMVLMK